MPFITIQGSNYDVEHIASWTLTPARPDDYMSRHSPDGKTFSARPQAQQKEIPARLVLTFKKGYGPKFTPIILTGDYAVETNEIIEASKSAKG